jgi:hypothetical protein
MSNPFEAKMNNKMTSNMCFVTFNMVIKNVHFTGLPEDSNICMWLGGIIAAVNCNSLNFDIIQYIAINHWLTGRIIATIFHTTKSLKQNIDYFSPLFGCKEVKIGEDSTHFLQLSM